MKSYKVVVTIEAEEDLKRYRNYLRDNKGSRQAAKKLVMDFRETRKQLEISADSLADPDSDKLKSRRLKSINLLKHDYFLLYRIDETDGIVYVTNMFHSREDYENKLR